ncbi:MAG: hypothetical protein IJU95_04455 [Treponema sp.]|nr:hypothetical protein [Treponema sp.]
MTKFFTHKFFMAALVLAALVVNSAAATAISFQVVQHDPTQDKIRSSSYVMETALFDNFFDSGHVTTNIPTTTSASQEEDEDIFFRSLSDSREGLCKYLIIILIDYDSAASKNPDAVLLSNIKSVGWILYDTESEAMLEKGERVVGKVPDKSNNIRGVKAFAKQISADINSAVGKR